MPKYAWVVRAIRCPSTPGCGRARRLCARSSQIKSRSEWPAVGWTVVCHTPADPPSKLPSPLCQSAGIPPYMRYRMSILSPPFCIGSIASAACDPPRAIPTLPSRPVPSYPIPSRPIPNDPIQFRPPSRPVTNRSHHDHTPPRDHPIPSYPTPSHHLIHPTQSPHPSHLTPVHPIPSHLHPILSPLCMCTMGSQPRCGVGLGLSRRCGAMGRVPSVASYAVGTAPTHAESSIQMCEPPRAACGADAQQRTTSRRPPPPPAEASARRPRGLVLRC